MLQRFLKKFTASVSGETNLQLTAFYSALAIVVALFSVPMLDDASKQYADNKALGIDTVITGSVEKSKKYTIRKSVLDKPAQ